MTLELHPSRSSVPADGRQCGALVELAGPLRRDVLHAIWWEIAPSRSWLHGLHRVGRCDTTFAWDDVRLGVTIRTVVPVGAPLLVGHCPCRDLLMDVLVEADRFLFMTRPANPAGAVRAHIRVRAIKDWIREGRVARGAQARADRIRTSKVGRLLPDEFHRAVLEHLVDEAGMPGPLEHQGQLVRRLADRLGEEFGPRHPAESHRGLVPAVVAALPLLEEVCRKMRRIRRDGELITWWECYVQRPLGRRARHGDLPLGSTSVVDVACAAAEAALDGVLDAPVDSCRGERAVIDAILAAATDREPGRALLAAMREMEVGGSVPAGTTSALSGEPARIDAVLAAAASLLSDAVALSCCSASR